MFWQSSYTRFIFIIIRSLLAFYLFVSAIFIYVDLNHKTFLLCQKSVLCQVPDVSLGFPSTGYDLPWENERFEYPNNFAQPLQIAIDASNGASDYGNKFGEPVILGFARSFGMTLTNGERREWIKPIMFSGGIGCIEDEHIKKLEPSKGMFLQ